MKVTDWTGNKKSAYSILGANNHSVIEREKHDYYATPSTATEKLLERESFLHSIWEPACGGGHISEVLFKYGYKVISTDKYNYGYNKQNLELDFLASESDIVIHSGDIITNPPYKYVLEFCEKALDRIQEGRKVAMLLKLTFLEGKKRKSFLEKNRPKKIYVFSSRINCAKNGNFNTNKASAICYAWFVWEKGFSGKTTEINWI